MSELRRNLDQVFDLKHMVVSNLVRDKRLLNRMFQDIGGDAFRFLIRAGLYFGFYIGLVQVAVFGITGSDLVLPLFGLITGGLTDYVALTMIFRPKEEKRIAPGITWQGIFHKRRAGGDTGLRRVARQGHPHPRRDHGQPAHRADVGQVLRDDRGRDPEARSTNRPGSRGTR